MHWLVLVIGLILGGTIRYFYYKKKESKILNILSFIVPFAFGILFWIMLYDTGYHVTFYSTITRGLEKSNQESSKWIMIVLTSCAIAGISWGFGAIIEAVKSAISKKENK